MTGDAFPEGLVPAIRVMVQNPMPVWRVVQTGLPFREFLLLKGFVMKKMFAGVAVAASLVGISAAAAPQAMAIGDRGHRPRSTETARKSVFGNSTTRGS